MTTNFTIRHRQSLHCTRRIERASTDCLLRLALTIATMPVTVQASPNKTCRPTTARKAGSLEGISIPERMIDLLCMLSHPLLRPACRQRREG